MNNSENLPEKAEVKALKPVVTDESSILLDTNRFEHLQRVASMFASSTLVPEIYQKSAANCFIAAHIAHRLNIDPFTFMQNSYIVKGKPSIEGKLVIALLNTRGPYPDGVQYEMKGNAETRSCRAFGVRKNGTVDEMEVTFQQAKAAGWVEKNPNWKNLPDLMLRYRAATFLCRTHCPEVIQGMETKEEIIDVNGVTVVGSARSKGVSSVNELLEQAS